MIEHYMSETKVFIDKIKKYFQKDTRPAAERIKDFCNRYEPDKIAAIYGYGSGVIEQEGISKKGKQTDLWIVVDDNKISMKEWHAKNMKIMPSKYLFLSRPVMKLIPEQFQKSGGRVYSISHSRFKGRNYKLMIIAKSDALRDLTTHDVNYFSGRDGKEMAVIKEDKEMSEARKKNRDITFLETLIRAKEKLNYGARLKMNVERLKNICKAVLRRDNFKAIINNSRSLDLEEKLRRRSEPIMDDTRFYTVLAKKTYIGDIRLFVLAERLDKVKAIVKKGLPFFRNKYPLEEVGIVKDENGNSKLNRPQALMQIDILPENMQQKMASSMKRTLDRDYLSSRIFDGSRKTKIEYYKDVCPEHIIDSDPINPQVDYLAIIKDINSLPDKVRAKALMSPARTITCFNAKRNFGVSVAQVGKNIISNDVIIPLWYLATKVTKGVVSAGKIMVKKPQQGSETKK